jgi:hypothetical protein
MACLIFFSLGGGLPFNPAAIGHLISFDWLRHNVESIGSKFVHIAENKVNLGRVDLPSYPTSAKMGRGR